MSTTRSCQTLVRQAWHSAGRSPRGFGQQRAGADVVQDGPSGDSARGSAEPTRSRTSSRTIATNRRSVPTVAPRSAGRPSAARVVQRDGVEVPHHLHVVAHEPDRHDHHAGHAVGLQRGEVVADVGLEPRDLRGAPDRDW